MNASAETFQISDAQAEIYESRFVPAIFADWASPMVDAAAVQPGMSVLDVACGTGVVARVAAERVGPAGKVVGLDLNEAMVKVARRLRPDIEWSQGDGADMPYADHSFDVVLCQSALMFFPYPVRALSEMRRVVKPEGMVAVQVYASLDSQPGYRPFIDIVARHAGPEAIEMLGTYWVHGDLDRLRELFGRARLRVTEIRSRAGTATFDSIDDFVRTEVESTPLITRLGDEVYAKVLQDAREGLRQFSSADGRAEVPLRGHIVLASAMS